jgi:hypothetical protein
VVLLGQLVWLLLVLLLLLLLLGLGRLMQLRVQLGGLAQPFWLYCYRGPFLEFLGAGRGRDMVLTRE